MSELTDEMLAELALAADPNLPIADGVEPFDATGDRDPLLPEWYMPMPRSARRTRPRVLAAVVIIASLLAVNAVGLCVTYGWPEIAW